MTTNDLIIGNTYLWTYLGQSVPIVYMGRNGDWHRFSGIRQPDVVAYEITGDEIGLIGELE